MRFFKHVGWIILAQLRLDALAMLLRASALADEGWFERLSCELPIDRNGRRTWYTYPAIHFIAPRLQPSFRVFEYGSGNLTRWYAKRVREVVAVEHDAQWAAEVSSDLPGNGMIVVKGLNDGYEKEIDHHGLFDIVVIDGRNRSQCVSAAPQALKPDGIIIWDNSDKSRYAEWIKHLLHEGFREIAFRGMTPIVQLILLRPQ